MSDSALSVAHFTHAELAALYSLLAAIFAAVVVIFARTAILRLMRGLRSSAGTDLSKPCRIALDAAESYLDVAGAVVALVLLLPLLIAIAVAIRATSKGPVLVRQCRRGRDGTTSTGYVFRTRAWQSSCPGSAAQVTAVGWFLRRCGLHRLPRLTGVLADDILLLGR